MAVVVQAAGTIALWVRRWERESSRFDWLEGFEMFNGHAALGSVLCGTCSLILLLSRQQWRITRPSALRTEPDEWALNVAMAPIIGFLWAGVLRGLYVWSFGVGRFALRFFHEKGSAAPRQYAGQLFLLAVLPAALLSVAPFRRLFYRNQWCVYRKPDVVVIGSILIVCILIEGISFLVGAGIDLRLNGGGWKDPWSDRLFVV